MKKIIKTLLASLLVFSAIFSLGACNNANNDATTSNKLTNVLFADFEAWGPDFQLCRVSRNFGKVSINSDEQYVYEGKHSARIDPVGYGWMYFPTVSETYEYDYSDFTCVHSVRVEIYNPQETNQEVKIGFVSRIRSIDRVDRAGTLPFALTPGWNTVDLIVEPALIKLVASLNKIEGILFEFEPNKQEDIAEDTPRFYLDSIRLLYKNESIASDKEIVFGDSEIMDFERIYDSSFCLNSYGIEMGIVTSANYGVTATSGTKALRMLWPAKQTGSGYNCFELQGSFLKAGAIGKVKDEDISSAYICFDVYNSSGLAVKANTNFYDASGRNSYATYQTLYPKEWTKVRIKLSDITAIFDTWTEDPGAMAIMLHELYDFDLEIFVDNIRVEYDATV